jgi:hypothetical protein
MIGDEYLIDNYETYNFKIKNNFIKNIFNYILSKCFI